MESDPSILGSVRHLCNSGVEIAHARLELLSLEVQEEKLRIVNTLILGTVSAALGILAVTLITLAVIALCSAEIRVAALLVMGTTYGTVAIAFWRFASRRLQREIPFENSLIEMKKDKVCFQTSDSGH
jgi:uncharacterized membrane protein YqjE